MNLLVLGRRTRSRRMVAELASGAGHVVECCEPEDLGIADPSRFDLVIVDGEASGAAARAELVDMLDWMRARNRRVPIAVLTWVGAEGAHEQCGRHAGGPCGLFEGADGHRVSRCQLRELAFSETAALLRHVAESDPREPVTFVYQG